MLFIQKNHTRQSPLKKPVLNRALSMYFYHEAWDMKQACPFQMIDSERTITYSQGG